MVFVRVLFGFILVVSGGLMVVSGLYVGFSFCFFEFQDRVFSITSELIIRIHIFFFQLTQPFNHRRSIWSYTGINCTSETYKPRKWITILEKNIIFQHFLISLFYIPTDINHPFVLKSHASVLLISALNSAI